MTERISKCPNCGAVLKPSRFAREATCEFCRATVQLDESAVEVQPFREAYARWNAPPAGDPREWFTLGGESWTALALLAHGEISDVYVAERARWPAERALLKVLRDPADLPMLELEWTALHALRASPAHGAAALRARLPDPLARGVVDGGRHAGRHAVLLRWAPGFEHTLEAVREAHPGGVDPQIGVWMWRRVLEILRFVHASGYVHGALLPQHLLVERDEHGLRLVGYGCAGERGAPLAAVVSRYEQLYPRALLAEQRLEPRHDLAMSARCIGFVLGADVPRALRALLDAVGDGSDEADAWALHTRLGTLARELFGPPSFHPLVMPQPR